MSSGLNQILSFVMASSHFQGYLPWLVLNSVRIILQALTHQFTVVSGLDEVIRHSF